MRDPQLRHYPGERCLCPSSVTTAGARPREFRCRSHLRRGITKRRERERGDCPSPLFHTGRGSNNHTTCVSVWVCTCGCGWFMLVILPILKRIDDATVCRTFSFDQPCNVHPNRCAPSSSANRSSRSLAAPGARVSPTAADVKRCRMVSELVTCSSSFALGMVVLASRSAAEIQ